MSLVLDIKNFPNLSSVLAEIEKKGRRPENFTAVYSEFEQLHQHERKPASFTAMEGDSRAFIATDSQLANFDEEVRKPRSSTVTGDMRTFIEIDPEDVNLYSLERKPRSSSMMERGAVVDVKANGSGGQHNPFRLGRRGSDPTGQTLKTAGSRVRIHSAPPCLSVDRETLLADRRFTDAAKNLSDEQLALLYEDIVKPLDFYALLHERRKQF